MKFPYEWKLSDGYPAKGVNTHNLKVFGTFICGGGSSMGYKLAGYNHIGGVEIDPIVADIYKTNHKPKHLYVEDIREFNKRDNLPAELYELDLLDGSPPCSSFSMAGNRDKDWGKDKQFREGQSKQRLDDLVFEYIKTIKKLQPKVAVLENVKGLILGNAKSYSKKMKLQFEEAGYKVQVFLCNSASMGVPQRRERVFFIGLRKDLELPPLNLKFSCASVKFGDVTCGAQGSGKELTEIQRDLWNKQKPKDRTLADVRGSANGFTDYLISINQICPTITAGGKFITKSFPRWFTAKEYCKCGSYPMDYNFKELGPQYLIGMSVPPVMTANISHEIYKQWLSKVGV